MTRKMCLSLDEAAKEINAHHRIWLLSWGQWGQWGHRCPREARISAFCQLFDLTTVT